MIIKIENGVPRHPLWRMAEPINLEIKRGEQIAIVGDNAAGKSRLVEVLTGHYPLLQNEVHYEFSSSKLRLVSENLKYISFRDAYGPQNSTYYYQRRWNLGDQSEEDSPLIVLSSGELRKYQINKALASNPRILILDNPFIGLDAPSRKDFRELLERLTRETELLVILVLSKRDDIPDFITHVLPIEGLRLLPKMTLEEYRKQYAALPKPQLNEKIKNWIADLPVRELNDSDFYPASGGEILRFKDVSIKYGNRTILQPLNWTVHEGECWALTGKNGSGKSTLLSLVCADNPQAYACDIQLFGHRRGTGESIWEIKRHIGYVSPEMHRAYLKDIPAIDVVASGLNDSVGLYVRPKPEQKQICLDWMQVFGVEEVSDRSFLQLSSGEQRLCLLAQI